MLKKMFTVIFLSGLTLAFGVGCSPSEGVNDGITTRSSYTSIEEAREASPSGEVCTFGEVEEVFVPSNRGRGNDNGEYVIVDNRTYEPAYIRMDVNYDGVINTDDAKLATRNIYVKQIENEECPAVADIGTFPQGFGPDEFFTAEDIYQWNNARHSGDVLAVYDQLAEEDKLICASQCAIINHMSPAYKHNQ